MDQSNGRTFPSTHFPSSPPFIPRLHDLEPTSSEPPTSPPLFSSDPPEEADITNYESPRLKRKYAGTWWNADEPVVPTKRKRSKLARGRNLDSGCWMPSDDSVDMDILSSSDLYGSGSQELLYDPTEVATKGMRDGEALLYRSIVEGVEKNDTAYVFNGLDLEDSEISHVGALEQVIHVRKYVSQRYFANIFQPPPDPGLDVPTQGQYRSMVPNITLNLSNNRLSRLTPSLFSIQHLTTLSLRGNMIQELPPQIGQLKNLKHLDLSFNELKYLPSEIIHMLAPNGNLTQLELWQNPLLTHPRDISLLDMYVREYSGLGSLIDKTTNADTSNLPEINRKFYQYLKDTCLPEILDESSEQGPRQILPFYDKMKLLNVFEHRHQDSDSPSAAAADVEMLCLLGNTSISYYDRNGDLLKGAAKFPQSAQDHFDYIVCIKDPTSGPTTYGAPPTWFAPPSPRTKVPSLFTAALTTALKNASPAEIEEELYDNFGVVPDLVERQLQRATENEKTHFDALRTCDSCGRKYTVPAAEWLDFWNCGHGGSQHPSVIPVRIQVCSWGCVPDDRAASPL